jgi:hypothetical protein
MSRPGRPTLFDSDKQRIFLRLVAAGIATRRAARHVGVSPSTVREKARTSAAFRLGYDKAKSEAVANLLDSVHTAGTRSWRASAWLLERLRPEEFGRRQPLPPPPPQRRKPSSRYRRTEEDLVNEFFDRLGTARHVWETVRARFAQLETFIADEKRRHEEYLRWAKWRGLPLTPEEQEQAAALEDNAQQAKSDTEKDSVHHNKLTNLDQSLPLDTANDNSANNSPPVFPPQNPELQSSQ